MLEMPSMSEKPEALQRAIKNAGGQAELARRIGVTTQAVSQWRAVPPLQVLTVERASGVSRCELRPDLYPADDEARA